MNGNDDDSSLYDEGAAPGLPSSCPDIETFCAADVELNAEFILDLADDALDEALGE
jgi:hypothetical protein